MGAAAYNRGSALLSHQIDAQARPVEFSIMDALNALTKRERALAPWGPIHFIAGHGGWWATCPVSGYGFLYDTLRDAVRAWRVTITGYDNGIWIAEPIAAAKEAA